MLLFAAAYVSPRTRAVCAAGFILMGIAIEFLQRMTGYRTFDVFDMLANAVGVALGWSAALVYARIRR